jgi:hypothetical protein
MQDAEPEQVEIGTPIHDTLDDFQAIDLTLNLTIQANRQLYLIPRMKRMNLRSPIRSIL